jgi:hypothetical protein
MLVYLGREWGWASVKEIAGRLHRDPSIISRLYSGYAADRDEEKETRANKWDRLVFSHLHG